MRAERDVGRARVTPTIEKTLFELVQKETDYHKKKKHPASWYQNQVADQLGLSEKDNPSLRSYEELLRGFKNKLRKQNQTEDLWSIGSSDEVNVPSSIIPVLLKIEKFLDKFPNIPKSQILSKRHAKWYARLYPAVKSVVNNQKQKAYDAFRFFLLFSIKTKLENSNDESLKKMAVEFTSELNKNPNPTLADISYLEIIWLVVVGLQYARAEQISSSPELIHFDTSELDHLFFIQEDLSFEAFFDGFGLIFFTNEQINTLPKHKEIPLKDLKASLGDITQKQASNINEYLQAMSSGLIERRKWIRVHPEEYAEVNKLLEKLEVKK